MPIDDRVHVAPNSLTMLREIGIPANLTHRALLAGHLHRRAASPFHPVTQPGTAAWSWTNERLRRELAKRGWVAKNPLNVPMAISPDGSLQVTALSGNVDTGNPERYPDTARPRGDGSISGVEDNLQAEIFKHVERMREATRTTWWLLFHFDEKQDEIRAELSQPLKVEDGHVKKWGPRLLIPTLDVGPDSLPEALPDDTHIDVDVRAIDG